MLLFGVTVARWNITCAAHHVPMTLPYCGAKPARTSLSHYPTRFLLAVVISGQVSSRSMTCVCMSVCVCVYEYTDVCTDCECVHIT